MGFVVFRLEWFQELRFGFSRFGASGPQQPCRPRVKGSDDMAHSSVVALCLVRESRV